MPEFVKYQGLGNDFIVVDLLRGGVDLDDEAVRRLCDRHFGVGADGVLSILPSASAAARMVVHNADASIAEMCGNGLRCVVKHLAERDASRPATLAVETGAGVLTSTLDWRSGEVERVTVEMGPARLEAPILPNGGPFVAKTLDGWLGTAVSMGNPHFVLLEGDARRAGEVGPSLERHERFPQRANVEFVSLDASGGLAVTVWERGVGLTLACGTGACAAVVAWGLAGRCPFDAWVPVRLPGGVLDIKVARDLSQVWLRGPATRVYRGNAE